MQGQQHASIRVEGRRSWSGAADLSDATFEVSRLSDGRLAGLKGSADLLGDDGSLLGVQVDVGRLADGAVGTIAVRHEASGKIVNGVIVTEAPRLDVAEGVWSVTAVATWGAFYRGLWVAGTISLNIRSRMLDPDVGSLAIEGGRAAINRSAVTIDARPPVGATEMRVANGSDPTSADWQPIASTFAWTLDPGDGEQTVSAQFGTAGTASGITFASIVIDTVPPSLTVDSHHDGDEVDLSDGSIVPLAGTATDDRSGVVTVDGTVDGHDLVVQLQEDTWASTVTAGGSGEWTYELSAVDVAGNTGSTSVTLSVKLPPKGVTIVRPGVINLDTSPLLATLSSVDTDGLTFAGDQRYHLGGATTIVSSPIPGKSPNGLLRRLGDRSLTASGDTRIATSMADVFDVYAQLAAEPEAATPTASRQLGVAAARTGTARCDEFADEGDVGAQLDLPDITASFPIPTPGSVDVSADVGAKATLAANLDFAFAFDIGWSGIDIQEFRSVAGFLVCGDYHLGVSGPLDQVMGPQWTAGAKEDDLKAHYGIHGLDGLSASVQLALGKDAPIGEPLFLGRIPLGPLPIYVQPTIGMERSLIPELSVDLRMDGTFTAGGTAGVQYDNGFKFVGEKEFSGTVDAASASADASVKFRAGPRMGLVINEAVKVKFVSATMGIGPEVQVDWQANRVGADSSITKVKAGLCADAMLSVFFEAGIGVEWGIFSFNLNLLEFQVSDITWDLGCPWSKTWTTPSTPLQITTESGLSPGEVDSPYLARLSATDDAIWSVVSGSPPSGLVLQPSGAFAGAPTVPGSYTFTARAIDHFRRASTKVFTIVVADKFRILSSTMTPFTAGIPYSSQLASNRPATWELIDGTLPDGVSLSTSGLLAGTPASSEGRVITVAAHAEDGAEATGVLRFGAADLAATALVMTESTPCAIVDGGIVKCWGSNYYGQLGGGVQTIGIEARAFPGTVEGIQGATAIAQSRSTTCAIVTGGTVKCWGGNEYGELGNGSPTRTAEGFVTWSRIPVNATGVSGATAIAASRDHFCVVLGDKTVKCWGNNLFGQLGIGKTSSEVRVAGEPTAVIGLSNVRTLATDSGSFISCAVITDGTASCWGLVNEAFAPYGISSQWPLADASFGSDGYDVPPPGNPGWRYAPTPFRVAGVEGATAVDVGVWHACAIVTDGRVSCWGSNGYGQLGIGEDAGTEPNPIGAVMTKAISGVRNLSVDGYNTCATVRSGTVWCWGRSTGELPLADWAEKIMEPVKAPGLDGNTTMTVDRSHVGCATVVEGGVTCWGDNRDGALGRGLGEDELPASWDLRPVVGITGATVIAKGGGYGPTCAIVTNGAIRCWGSNSAGQLGTGMPREDLAYSDHSVPVLGIAGHA